ncbi:type III secretion protein [Salinicola rhizosphaerae]|uniref:Type III secretion protein n=1 Tax=Salinicola rhizosphaerae TaxID=1443141 RepID=A0ABQ3DQA7_9GAMM|nr:type III secretion protein [Salinicola rhizosphaerae]GHB11811.1 hypothetical protein GCM10009038_06720 [Salinicola rhizosphaerae]
MSQRDDRDAADLLHLIGYLYLQSGQRPRGLVLLLVANRLAPGHTGILHALCQGFLASGQGQRALHTIERIEATAPNPPDPALTLLRGRAQALNGDTDQARASYRDYLAQRRLARAEESGRPERGGEA